MKPSKNRPAILIVISLAFFLLNVSGSISTAQAQVQVTAADPPSAAQGTINLNVKVTGKGFKNGAKAKWFVTGTTDTGGVTVNSTAFVNSTEVDANITVSDTAVIANFDIAVTNPDGRGGKGTELFAVTAKGNNVLCPAMQPAPTSDTKCYDALPGCLDSTFGGIGYVHTDAYPPYVSGGDQADGVAVQPDDKIVVAGRTRISSTDIDYTVIRYNLDGSLDTSFGDLDPLNPPLRRGYTLTSITTGFDYTYGLTLQPDGKIVVSGSASGGGGAVVRYNADGTLDPAFGSGGIVTLSSSFPRRDIALQADGKIILGGTPGNANAFALARLNANGSVDSSFGSGGLVTANPSGAKRGYGVGWYLAIQSVPAITGEERIVLAGWSVLSGSDNADWTVMRFRSNGAIDTSFGTSGIVKTYFSGFGDQARMVQIDSSNRIVVAGITNSANSSCGTYIGDVAVVRYTENGSLDGSFGGGKQIFDIYGGGDTLIHGLAIQADGKILSLGTTKSSDNSKTFLMLARLTADGSRDSSFGLLGNGVVTTDLYGTQSWGLCAALDPTSGKLVAAGGAYLGSGFTDGQIFVARYLP